MLSKCVFFDECGCQMCMLLWPLTFAYPSKGRFGLDVWVRNCAKLDNCRLRESHTIVLCLKWASNRKAVYCSIRDELLQSLKYIQT